MKANIPKLEAMGNDLTDNANKCENAERVQSFMQLSKTDSLHKKKAEENEVDTANMKEIR